MLQPFTNRTITSPCWVHAGQRPPADDSGGVMHRGLAACVPSSLLHYETRDAVPDRRFRSMSALPAPSPSSYNPSIDRYRRVIQAPAASGFSGEIEQITQLRTTLHEREVVARQLQTALDHEQSRNALLETLLEERQAELEHLQREHYELGKMYETTRLAWDEARTRVQMADTECSQTQGVMSHWKRELERLSSERLHMNQLLVEAQSGLCDAQGHNEHLTQTIHQLQKELGTSSLLVAVQDLKRRGHLCDELLQSLNRLQEKLERSEEAVASQGHTYRCMANELENKTRMLDQTLAQLEHLQSHTGLIEKKCENQQILLQSLRSCMPRLPHEQDALHGHTRRDAGRRMVRRGYSFAFWILRASVYRNMVRDAYFLWVDWIWFLRIQRARLPCVARSSRCVEGSAPSNVITSRKQHPDSIEIVPSRRVSPHRASIRAPYALPDGIEIERLRTTIREVFSRRMPQESRDTARKSTRNVISERRNVSPKRQLERVLF